MNQTLKRKISTPGKEDLVQRKKIKRQIQDGYVFGAHAKEDAIRNKDKRLPITKDMCAQILKYWTKFVMKYNLTQYELRPGSAVPDHTTLKEFIRFYIYDAKGRIYKNGRPVMSSVVNCAERLFGGFQEKISITIIEEDRQEIYNISAD
ncbi:hypothetical protein N7456_004937 [Penicillium angulare]|uniref:Uncharacterized protein n=1 Tax=Penicillium angulare TaxID=116970 RepID=A0A9W9FZ65_9EURO|nr:hypothetical protein N7456_004937 [Penicillium angulare]